MESSKKLEMHQSQFDQLVTHQYMKVINFDVSKLNAQMDITLKQTKSMQDQVDKLQMQIQVRQTARQSEMMNTIQALQAKLERSERYQKDLITQFESRLGKQGQVPQVQPQVQNYVGKQQTLGKKRASVDVQSDARSPSKSMVRQYNPRLLKSTRAKSLMDGSELAGGQSPRRESRNVPRVDSGRLKVGTGGHNGRIPLKSAVNHQRTISLP